MQPQSWNTMTQEFAGAVRGYNAGRAGWRADRERITRNVSVLRTELHANHGLDVPPDAGPKLQKAVEASTAELRAAQERALDGIEALIEDFDHAAENEDRFVVLVFGEVNAGKSALANQVAGLDFDSATGARAQCFVGRELVDRLDEQPVECTRQYQGFRLPGLLWIDCPGVLSETIENGDMARRLVGRADFILLVTNSSSPFKESEMQELARLIQASGRDRLEACMVVSKADRQEQDEDEDGELISRIMRKPQADIDRQVAWGNEQFKRSGLRTHLRWHAPVPVSVYVARDAMGREWKTGRKKRDLPADWSVRYDSSGLPALHGLLGKLVRTEGPALKAAWPKRRSAALKMLLGNSADRGDAALEPLDRELATQRKALTGAARAAGDAAAARIGAQIPSTLQRHRVHEAGRFDRDGAEHELREKFTAAVQHAVTTHVCPVLQAGLRHVNVALQQCLRDSAAFQLDVQTRTRQQSYATNRMGQAVGSATGGGLGGLGGAEIGALIGAAGGPVGVILGAVAGGLLGGLFGGWFGRKVGGQVKQTRTVEVVVGTNGDEVIATAVRSLEKSARAAVAETVTRLESGTFTPLAAEVSRLRGQITRWRKW